MEIQNISPCKEDIKIFKKKYKKYKAKENYGNSNISPCKEDINLQKIYKKYKAKEELWKFKYFTIQRRYKSSKKL